jgi:hypothetical protein
MLRSKSMMGRVRSSVHSAVFQNSSAGLAIGDAADSFDHLVSPEDAIRIAMARQ